MKILITNNALSHRTGSELYVMEVAQELLKRGHKVGAYSNVVGDIAKQMNKAGVETVDDLNKLSFKPDVIHGQHHLETMTALSHFSEIPVFYLCHGWKPWQEKPPLHPRILRYGAVDSLTLDFATRNKVPKSKIELVHNFVDLKRFKQRKPLPKKPQKALIFNNAAAETNYTKMVREACNKAGIKKIDVVGQMSGNVSNRPELMLKDYDVMFARGRCALEGLATGVAVIVCAETGVGPLVTTKNMKELRDKNFGTAAVYSEPNAEVIYKEIMNYNAEDAASVTTSLRELIGIEQAAENLENIYENIIKKFKTADIKKEDEDRAMADYLRETSAIVKEKEAELVRHIEMVHDRDKIIALRDTQIVELSRAIEQKDHEYGEQIKNQEKEAEKLRKEIGQKDQEIEAMKASKFWKLRGKYVAIRRIFRKN